MTADDVVEILDRLECAGVGVCVDGGWGVDALLGEQTRAHNDLDLAIDDRDLDVVRDVLTAFGYREASRPIADLAIVFRDGAGRVIDVHPYAFDREGRLVRGIPYPRESLAGRGTIAGRGVRCITPDWAVRFHTQYEPDENDFHDVRALCARFGIALPAIYERFAGESSADTTHDAGRQS